MKKHILLLILALAIALWTDGQNIQNTQLTQPGFNDLSLIKALNSFNTGQTNLRFVNKHQDFLNSRRDTKQGMDSLISYNWNTNNNQWEPGIKYEFYYNDSGKNTIAIILSWDATNNVWENYSKTLMEYNEYGELTLYAQYTWSQQWTGSFKNEIDYDENGNMLHEIISAWDQNTSQWVLNHKYEYTYNSNNNMLSEFSYNWDLNNNTWINSYKKIYTYNSGNLLILTIRSFWDSNNNTWVYSYKNEYSYDAAGNLILHYEYDWDFIGNVWKNSKKDEYTYDSDGHMVTEINLTWDSGCNVWGFTFKTEYVYNTDGKLTTETYYNWDTFSNQWIPDSKTHYAYDIDDNLILQTDYNWDTNTNQWVNNEKQNYSYDNNYTYDDLLIPFLYSDELYMVYFTHMLTEYVQFSWDAVNNQWSYNSKGVLYYSAHETNGINDIHDSGVKVYPNPATDHINFDLTGIQGTALIELFDMQGRLITSKETSGDTYLPVAKLTNGLYLYRISYNGKIQQGKIIIK